MSYYNIPERPLDPPEDSRRHVYRCAICGDPIREGDDYYVLPLLGKCCEACVDDSKRYGAELEYPGHYGEED